MSPEEQQQAQPSPFEDLREEHPPAADPPRSTTSKLMGLLVVVICFEVGVFLLVFPWMDAWTKNWLPTLGVEILDLWESNYFRGALSGLGAINIYISFLEMMRLLRG